MRRSSTSGSFARALLTISALAIIVTGVTFAALQSQTATLEGSSVSSATANLQIGTTNNTFGPTAVGYNFANVEPGGAPAPSTPYHVFLKNAGSSTLSLKLALDSNTFANPGDINTGKVSLVLTPTDGGTAQTIPLATLLSDYSSNSPLALNLSLAPGTIGDYQLQISMASDVVSTTTSGITLSGLNLIFSGTSTNAS